MSSPLLAKFSPVKALVANTDPATLAPVWPRTMWVQTDDDDTPTVVLGVYVRNQANTAWLPFAGLNPAGTPLEGSVVIYIDGRPTWVLPDTAIEFSGFGRTFGDAFGHD